MFDLNQQLLTSNNMLSGNIQTFSRAYIFNQEYTLQTILYAITSLSHMKHEIVSTLSRDTPTI